jgi:hypothetical protein
MADTDNDAVRKQKKAKYDKQYRLKVNVHLSSLMMKVPDHVYVLG